VFRLRLLRPLLLILVTAGIPAMATAQISFTDPAATGAWNTARWNNSADAAPYSSTYTAGNAVSFTTGPYAFAGMGASLDVGNVTVSPGVQVTFPTIGSTYATGGLVQTVNVGAGGLFDLNAQSVSTAAGTGFLKTGSGVFGTGAGTFTGGFTINDGTVVAKGTTGLGSGGSNTLALNGGTITANGNRDFANTRFPGGISVGGDVQFGAFAAAVSISSDSARVTFANDVNLGGARRTLTIGNFGNHRFSGVISNGSLTFAAVPGAESTASGAGRFDVSNVTNTFTGDIEINGPEVRFTADGSLGNSANSIVIDGGRFSKASDANTVTLGGGRSVFVGDTAGTGISSPGSGTLVINAGIQDKAGTTGSWSKQGGGTLELGGASTYTGETFVNNGTLRLAGGSNRLPTSTFVRLGQAASANVGTLDLNGNDQAIGGLASTAGSNATASSNTVTSVAPATLTVALASGTAAFGDGTTQNSGLITGAVSLVKSGAGVQVLGGTNTYTGTTLVSGGTLMIEGVQAGTGLVTVAFGAALGGNGGIGGSLLIASGGNLLFDATKTLSVNGTDVSFGGFSIQNLIGLDQSTPLGVYSLIDGDATLNPAQLSNVGAGNAFPLGGGKSAYFSTTGGLSVAVVPEPSTLALAAAGLGIAAVAARRRLRKA
jgi:fibronectin-binding autotransporter adhesin